MTKDTLTNLNSLGLLKISGIDAKKFLQGQLTCNLDEITETKSCLGAHCNPQGRMISLFRIFRWQDFYLLQMPKNLISIAHQALKKYAVFFKVELSDVSDQFIQLGYCGENLKNLISVPENDNETLFIQNCLIIKIPGALTRYEILTTKEFEKTFQQKLISSTNIAEENQWKTIDFTIKLPEIYPETSEKYLPHEINLPQHNGVSFNKGCYTGQEIIARMHYLGKLKKHLELVENELPDAPIRGENIVDYCQISYNKYQLLILAK